MIELMIVAVLLVGTFADVAVDSEVRNAVVDPAASAG